MCELLRGKLKHHLPYYWTFAVAFTGNHTAIHPRKIQSAWKPVVAFGEPRGWVSDLLHGGGLVNNDHEWQQPESEAEYLIRKLTQPSELVVDPFAGPGSVLLAASKLDRRFFDCELDRNVARGARRRLGAQRLPQVIG